MQINAPATITPVVNINQPTEALRTDIRRLERIPESAQSSDSARLRQGATEQDGSLRIQERTSEQNSQDEGNSDESLADNSSSSQSNRQAEAREQREIRELQATDREVRAHEAAHASVGGVFAGSPSFTFVTGPNGVRYAVAGEVPIDVSKVPNDPEATLNKARQVRRAALAPADPSNQDRQVAAQAAAIATEAIAELALERIEERESQSSSTISSSQTDVAEQNSSQVSAAEVSRNEATQNRFLRRLQLSGAVASPTAGSNINTQA